MNHKKAIEDSKANTQRMKRGGGRGKEREREICEKEKIDIFII